MRLWLNVVVSALALLAEPMAVEARGGGGGAVGHAMVNGLGSRPHAGSAALAKPVAGPKPGAPRFGPDPRFAGERETRGLGQSGYRSLAAYEHGNGYNTGGIGYGVPGLYADAAGYDPRLAGALPGAGYPPPYFYGEERAPQLTCFRPRLIQIGRSSAPKTHLPKVVYGGPLPCGYRGT